jgi:hypothetical protein
MYTHSHTYTHKYTITSSRTHTETQTHAHTRKYTHTHEQVHTHARAHRCVAATGLKPNSYNDLTESLPALHSFTFLRLGPELLQPSHQTPWLRFMLRMQHEHALLQG